jgi:hypothetical protein
VRNIEDDRHALVGPQDRHVAAGGADTNARTPASEANARNAERDRLLIAYTISIREL